MCDVRYFVLWLVCGVVVEYGTLFSIACVESTQVVCDDLLYYLPHVIAETLVLGAHGVLGREQGMPCSDRFQFHIKNFWELKSKVGHIFFCTKIFLPKKL